MGWLTTKQEKESPSLNTRKFDLPESLRKKYPGQNDEQMLIGFCNDSVRVTAEGMPTIWRLWDKYDEYWNGDQKIPDSRYFDKTWQDKSILNKIVVYGEQKVALLTDVRPATEVFAINDESKEADDTAKGINDYIKFDLEKRLGSKRNNEKVVRDGLKKDLGFVEVGWDEDADNGVGSEIERYLNPKWVRWKPIVDDWNNLDLLVVMTPEDTAQMKRKFPDFEKDIIEDWNGAIFNESIGIEARYATENEMIVGDDDGISKNRTKTLRRRLENSKGVSKLVRVFWIDHETKQSTLTVADDGTPIEVSSLKYPTWRVTYMHNNRILKDEPLKYVYAKMPNIIPFILNSDGEGLITVSPMASQVEVQDALNKTERMITDNAVIHGSGQWVIDTATGLTRKDVFNSPFWPIAYNSKQGQPPKKEYGHIPEGLFALSEKRKADMKEIADMTDTVQGIREPGVTAGIAIDLLRQIGQAKIRKMGQSLEDHLQVKGNYWVCILKQYRTETIERRYISDSGKREMLKLNAINEQGGRTNEISRWDYEFIVSPNTVLPANKKLASDTLKWLLEDRVIDDVAVREQLDIPGSERIAKRIGIVEQLVQQNQQLMQAVQQMQGQATQPQGPSPEYSPVDNGLGATNAP